MSQHTMHVEILDGSLYMTMSCPYDLADTERPCWPMNEDGTPYPAPAECNYKGWAENMMPDEWHRGTVAFDCDATLNWENGDYPLLELAPPSGTQETKP